MISAAPFSLMRASAGLIATGGDQIIDYTDDGVDWRAHVFTQSGTFVANQDVDVEYLVVAGGGGGAGGNSVGVGGGGGGSTASSRPGGAGGSGIVVIKYARAA